MSESMVFISLVGVYVASGFVLLSYSLMQTKPKMTMVRVRGRR